jgi:tetratricopeptide (TPR) repeat protein
MPETGGDSQSYEEALKRVIREILAEQTRAERTKGSEQSLFDRLAKYWPLIVASFSVVLTLIAWIGLGVSPLESVKEIRQKMKQHENQQELARRHIKLGNDLLCVGQPKAAESEFSRAKELDSYNEDADLGLLKATVFQSVEEKEYDPEIAQRRVQAILDLEGHEQDTHALAYLGDVLREIDPQEALADYEKAIASDQNNTFAYYGEALLKEDQGDQDSALKLYEKAIKISPWNQVLLNNAAYIYFQRQNYPKAQELYLRTVQLQPTFLVGRATLAETQMLMGDPQTADSNLEVLDGMLHDQAILKQKLTLNVGRAWTFQMHDRGKPVNLFSDQEKVVYLWYLLGLARQLSGNPTEATHALREAAVAAPHDIANPRRVIESDLANIVEAQPDLAKAAHKFEVALRAK